MNRALIVLGTLLIIAGLLWQHVRSLPLFHLPGDIVIERPGFKLFLPISSMLLVSLVVSLLVWLFRR